MERQSRLDWRPLRREKAGGSDRYCQPLSSDRCRDSARLSHDADQSGRSSQIAPSYAPEL